MAYLHAIATAVPRHSISQPDTKVLSDHLGNTSGDQLRTTEAIYRKCGVERRGSVLIEKEDGPVPERQSFYFPGHLDGNDPDGPSMRDRMAVYEKFAPELSRTSAKRAVDAGRYGVDDFAQLVTISCTGFASPGWEIGLVRDVLHPDVQRTHIGFMGCHASFNGLRTASALAEQAARPVLMTSCELCSVHHRYEWEPETTVANALFADGSGSVVLSPEADGAIAEFVGSASRVQPGTEKDMSWRLGNHGFVMTLSIEVPKVINRELRPWLDDWLAEHNLTVDQVAGWAIHPGGPRILAMAGETLGISREEMAYSYDVLRENGNMSSATVLFILEQMAGKVHGPVVGLGFGPGLTFEAFLLDFK